MQCALPTNCVLQNCDCVYLFPIQYTLRACNYLCARMNEINRIYTLVTKQDLLFQETAIYVIINLHNLHPIVVVVVVHSLCWTGSSLQDSGNCRYIFIGLLLFQATLISGAELV